jgi:hypothetical protein
VAPADAEYFALDEDRIPIDEFSVAPSPQIAAASWWLTRGTTCVTNQWILVRGPGRIELLSKPAPSAKQIAQAEYDPAKEQVYVMFQDGTTEQVEL